MGFMRKYNSLFKAIDNMIKLYKIAKKKDEEKKKNDEDNTLE